MCVIWAVCRPVIIFTPRKRMYRSNALVTAWQVKPIQPIIDFDDQMSRIIVNDVDSLMIFITLSLVVWTISGIILFLILSIPGSLYPGTADCKKGKVVNLIATNNNQEFVRESIVENMADAKRWLEYGLSLQRYRDRDQFSSVGLWLFEFLEICVGLVGLNWNHSLVFSVFFIMTAI